VARMACDSAVNGALEVLGPAVPPGSPTPGATTPASPFTALASHLHLNNDYREGPNQDLYIGYDAQEDTGVAVRVFRTQNATRVACFVADRHLSDLSTADRQTMIRDMATRFESTFPESDILIALRGRVLFGASAMKLGASPWQFQAGASIDQAPLHAFFAGILPFDDVRDVTGEPAVIHGETAGGEEDQNELIDCLGNFSLLPQARVRLASPFTGMSLRADAADEDAFLSVLLRRPDGAHTCHFVEGGGDPDSDLVVDESFPPGDYDVWVGGVGLPTAYELTIVGASNPE
jgi:hypothetical protein